MIKIKIPTKSTYFSSEVVSHSQMMDEIFEFAMKCGRFYGGGFFDIGFKKMNKKILFFLQLTIVTCIINIYDTYLFREDMPRCVFCILTISGQIQAFSKFYTFIGRHENILNLRKQSEKFHEHFSSAKSSKIFEEKFMILAHGTAVLTVLGGCTFILIAVYPIIYYFIYNKRILHFGLELPCIDWKSSWIGYGLNFIHQGGLIFAFVCMSIKTLCITFCFVINGICQIDVLNLLLDQLNELIIHNEDGSKDDEIHKNMKFLVEMHANVTKYLQQMKKTFLVYFFIEFLALVFQKTVELFSIISFNFIPGYLCAISTGLLTFLPCALGSMLISKGDEFYQNLYNISWHLLPICEQKILKLVITNSKKSKGLAAGIRTLELSAFVEIYKAIYSYLMLLQSFK